jgi:hypothetical protein
MASVLGLRKLINGKVKRLARKVFWFGLWKITKIQYTLRCPDRELNGHSEYEPGALSLRQVLITFQNIKN